MAAGVCRIDGCMRPVRCRSLCAYHYDQVIRGRTVRREPLTLADRFWAKVDKRGPNECWPWMGNKTQDGYGRIRRGGPRLPTTGAHRISYELNVGAIPDGLDIMHSCDNPPCCNPAHLKPGTDQDNADDKIAKGRARALRGEQSPNAKLRDADVAEIRRLYAAGGISQGVLARRFAVSQGHVSELISGSKRPPRPEECDRVVGR